MAQFLKRSSYTMVGYRITHLLKGVVYLLGFPCHTKIMLIVILGTLSSKFDKLFFERYLPALNKELSQPHLHKLLFLENKWQTWGNGPAQLKYSKGWQGMVFIPKLSQAVAVVAAAAVVVVSEFVVVVARAINFVNKIDFGTTTRSSHLKNFG